MPQTVERIGLPAAPGIAAGPLVVIDQRLGTRLATGNAVAERRDLEAAIAASIAAIRALAGRSTGEASEILEFQAAMLEDSALTEPAFARIADGVDAVAAWNGAVGELVADYEAAEDEYFRARASDLRDLRDEVHRRLCGAVSDAAPEGSVLAGDDVTPIRFLSVDWTRGGGIALRAGSPSSHVAMLARSRGVPMIVGLGDLDLSGHAAAIVNGDTGRIVLSPRAADYSAFEKAKVIEGDRKADEARAALRPAVTRDGEPVKVMINIAGPDELDALDPAMCDGIGLVRTEFLFHGARLPDEDTQFAAYARMAAWAAGRPVVLRTLDAGGDKPIEGLTVPGESNPFLGTRGIRLSLARPDVFRVQLRAMVRAAALGDVRVMLPMVTVPEEIDRSAALLDEVVDQLTLARIPCRRPALGIMVEVPAVAVVPETFANAAFFSIGSNDLTQYVTASARDISAVAALNDPGHPAVLGLIRNVVAEGARLDRGVSLCGDMGGEPKHLPALLAAGLRSVSVAPPLVGRAKRAIAAWSAASP
jgi:phosphoenolpyruvate-protein phosphotransferase (PTS system enzyme I)